MLPAKYEEAVEEFLIIAGSLREKRHELTGIASAKELREGPSDVLAADLQSERRLVPELCKLWPGVPVLCEEAGTSNLSELVPDVDVLPWGDDVTDVPPKVISVDGLDGSALYANGELGLTAISAGLVVDGRPMAAIVLCLTDSEAYVVDSRPGVDILLHQYYGFPIRQEPKRPLRESLIGLDDCKSVDGRFRRLVINRLTGSPGTKYPLNVPSCAGALKVLEGKLAAYVTSNTRHWDIAGTAALCEAAGMIVRCLDGSPVPWNRVRMPPVVFARDEEAFAYVQEMAKDFLVAKDRPVPIEEDHKRGGRLADNKEIDEPPAPSEWE